MNVKLSNDSKRYGDSRAISSAISFDPTQAIYDENSIYGGYFEYYSLEDNPANLHGHYNPVGMLNQVEDYYSKIKKVQQFKSFHFRIASSSPSGFAKIISTLHAVLF